MRQQFAADKVLKACPDGGTINVPKVRDKREIYYAYERMLQRNPKAIKTFTVTVSGELTVEGVPTPTPLYKDFIAGMNDPIPHEVLGYVRWHGAEAWRRLGDYLDNPDDVRALMRAHYYLMTIMLKLVLFTDRLPSVVGMVCLKCGEWLDRLEGTRDPKFTEDELEYVRRLLDQLPAPPYEEGRVIAEEDEKDEETKHRQFFDPLF